MDAKECLLMTFAFGINKTFKDVYRGSNAPFRLALLEKRLARSKRTAPN